MKRKLNGLVTIQGEPTLNCNTNKTLNISLLHNGRMNSEVTIVWNIGNFQLFYLFLRIFAWAIEIWNTLPLNWFTSSNISKMSTVIAIIHSSTSLMDNLQSPSVKHCIRWKATAKPVKIDLHKTFYLLWVELAAFTISIYMSLFQHHFYRMSFGHIWADGISSNLLVLHSG